MSKLHDHRGGVRALALSRDPVTIVRLLTQSLLVGQVPVLSEADKALARSCIVAAALIRLPSAADA
eukprot:9251946-Pyramimonas_sp.AAC.1